MGLFSALGQMFASPEPLHGEWVGNTFYDTPTSYGSFKPVSQMNALEKFGHIIDSATNPRYDYQYNADKNALNDLNRSISQQKALSQFSMNMPRDPAQALLKLSEITGDPSRYIDYQIQQNDPLRKIQLANAQAQLAEAENEKKRTEQLANLFSNPVTPEIPAAVPTSGIGPVRPAIPPRALSQIELASKAATIDPNRYGDNALSLFGQANAPNTEGLPEGYMWENGKAVKIPGIENSSTFNLPKGVTLPQGTVAVPDPTSPVGFKVVPVPGAQRSTTDYKDYQLKAGGFASRMVNTENIISTLSPNAQEAARGTSGYMASALSSVPSFGLGASLAEGVLKGAATPEQQQYLNAAQEWIRAKLRKESGAVISPTEMQQEYATYFPGPLDDKELIAQKAELRKQATDAMVKESNGAFETQYPDLAGPPAQPTTKEEFDALPVGRMFINPKDGKLMRKRVCYKDRSCSYIPIPFI